MSRNCVPLLGLCNQSMYTQCPSAQLSSAWSSAVAKDPKADYSSTPYSSQAEMSARANEAHWKDQPQKSSNSTLKDHSKDLANNDWKQSGGHVSDWKQW
jgi:hypothetical protein